MSNVHRHLLPHVTDTAVATALFTEANFDRDNDPVTTRTPIAGVADATSRTGGWSKAATEATNTCDEDRLDRLSRYSQRGVRRAVVTNPRVSGGTLRYLLLWAVAKGDDTLLAEAAKHQPVGRLIDAAGDQLPTAVRGGMALPLMAANAVANGPVADLVRLYTHEAIPQAAEEVVKWYDVFHRRYSPVEGDGPVIAFDELHRLAQPHTDRVPVGQLWMVGQMDRAIASVLVSTDEPTDRNQRVGANDCDVDAAVLLVEQQPGWNAALYTALSARQPLPHDTYDAILDALEAGSQDEWGARFRLVRRLVDNHVGHLSGAQADRFVDLLDGLYDAEYDSALTLLFDATFKEAGHLVDADRARRLIERITPSLIVEWSRKATAEYEVTELARPLDPVLLDALARRQAADMADVYEWRWVETVADELDGHDILQQTLLDAAGPVVLRMLQYGSVAAAAAGWFSREFDGDVERWQLALGLVDGWAGTVSDLIEAAHALAGGRPEAPEPSADQPVHTTGAQLGLFG